MVKDMAESLLKMDSQLPPEQILLMWINYHLKQAGVNRTVTNFGEDLKARSFFEVSFAVWNLTSLGQHRFNPRAKPSCTRRM